MWRIFSSSIYREAHRAFPHSTFHTGFKQHFHWNHSHLHGSASITRELFSSSSSDGALARIELISFWIAVRSLSGVTSECVQMQLPRISTGGVNNVRPQKQSSRAEESQYCDHTHTHRDTEWKMEANQWAKRKKRKQLLWAGLGFKQASVSLHKHFLISHVALSESQCGNEARSKKSLLCV